MNTSELLKKQQGIHDYIVKIEVRERAKLAIQLAVANRTIERLKARLEKKKCK